MRSEGAGEDSGKAYEGVLVVDGWGWGVVVLAEAQSCFFAGWDAIDSSLLVSSADSSFLVSGLKISTTASLGTESSLDAAFWLVFKTISTPVAEKLARKTKNVTPSKIRWGMGRDVLLCIKVICAYILNSAKKDMRN